MYVGKSLEFCVNNLWDFIFKGDESLDYFLLDDIIIIGIILKEVLKYFKVLNVKVYFVIVFCSVDE